MLYSLEYMVDGFEILTEVMVINRAEIVYFQTFLEKIGIGHTFLEYSF